MIQINKRVCVQIYLNLLYMNDSARKMNCKAKVDSGKRKMPPTVLWVQVQGQENICLFKFLYLCIELARFCKSMRKRYIYCLKIFLKTQNI